jgi:hypothetical protein
MTLVIAPLFFRTAKHGDISRKQKMSRKDLQDHQVGITLALPPQDLAVFVFFVVPDMPSYYVAVCISTRSRFGCRTIETKKTGVTTRLPGRNRASPMPHGPDGMIRKVVMQWTSRGRHSFGSLLRCRITALTGWSLSTHSTTCFNLFRIKLRKQSVTNRANSPPGTARS